MVTVDDFAKPVDFIIGQFPNARVRIDPGLREQVLACFQANAINVGESNLHALFTRQVNSR